MLARVNGRVVLNKPAAASASLHTGLQSTRCLHNGASVNSVGHILPRAAAHPKHSALRHSNTGCLQEAAHLPTRPESCRTPPAAAAWQGRCRRTARAAPGSASLAAQSAQVGRAATHHAQRGTRRERLLQLLASQRQQQCNDMEQKMRMQRHNQQTGACAGKCMPSRIKMLMQVQSAPQPSKAQPLSVLSWLGSAARRPVPFRRVPRVRMLNWI